MKYYVASKRKGISYTRQNKGRLIGLDKTGVGDGLLRHVVEEKIGGSVEVTGRRGRRSK
jgi:hypothetical protein